MIGIEQEMASDVLSSTLFLPMVLCETATQRQSCTVPEFLWALEKAVRKELGDRRSLELNR